MRPTHGEPMGGAAKDQVMGGSSGCLEARIARMVRDKLAAAKP